MRVSLRAVDPGKSDEELHEYMTKAYASMHAACPLFPRFAAHKRVRLFAHSTQDRLLTADSLVSARDFADSLFRAVAVTRSQTWVRSGSGAGATKQS